MSFAPLKKSTLLAFSLPAIPIAALGLPLSVYIPQFYSSVMGINMATVGLIFMLARFWDLFTDPMMGLVSDRFNTKWGRRKPWVVASVPVLMISVYFIFLPLPGTNAVGLALLVFMMYVGYTMLSLNHMSWGTDLASEYHQRSRIHGWREGFQIFGMVVVLAIPAAIALSGADHAFQSGVKAMGLFIIIFVPITVFIAARFVHDPSIELPDREIDWRVIWTTVKGNPVLFRLLAADLFAGLAPSITGASYLYFANYYMGLPRWSSLLLLLYFFAAVVAVPFWMRLAYKVGKHKALTFAMAYGAITLPLFVIGPREHIGWMAFCMIVYGFAFGAGSFLLRAIMADVVDHGQVKSGENQTGVFYALLMISSKAGSAIAVGLSFVVLDLIFGFDDAPGAVNTPEAINGVALVFTVFPVLAMATTALIMWGFPLDEDKQVEMRHEIEGATAKADGEPSTGETNPGDA